VPDPVITLTIDGNAVRVPKGTSILEAARSIGITIPYYCYHPGLSVVGSCRMCLVEIEKIPKLQPSCATPVGEGMVVRTQTPEVLKNRRSVLEFLLLNHPLDCPVCDQSGECELQNYYMAHGLYDPRFNENKTKRKKAYPVGPNVILDQERCILCTRCVRFTREISKTAELGVFERGHKSAIDVFPGMELNNGYAANVVDLCPVGALTDRDFRFQCRVWFLGRTASICPGCSRGCNIEIHYNERFNRRYHEKRVHRLKPRLNREVNGHWICDHGRYSYRTIDSTDRLRTPAVKDNGGMTEVTWDAALARVAAGFKGALAHHGPESVALLASPQMTNEELFRIGQLFRESLKAGIIDFRASLKDRGSADDFLMLADRNPNSLGAELLGLSGIGADALLRACDEGRVHFLYLCQHDLVAGYGQQAVDALSKVDFLVFHGSWDQPTARMADAILPTAVYAEREGTFTNYRGRVQKIHAAVPPLGDSLPDLEIIVRLAEALGVRIAPASPSEVFQELASRIPAFAGMSYDAIGDAGRLLDGCNLPSAQRSI
jgi:NADH-quinone oxidoreductase subunit G